MNKFKADFHSAILKVMSKNRSTEFLRFFKRKKNNNGSFLFRPRKKVVQVNTSTLSYKTKLLLKINK
jgi:hypothetical protein